ncbi:autotransporter outer membrane beta-barrel domain-containing protein [Phocoenobacter skyensis]|uniref:autotransporter outer membrane beta-barrel domain-containing protein n=1 Tax=Phocoenobacter skyensis TaxID=97481 RepID=UPI00274FD9E5|nr:autotransporter outer membrane beta-barrel domain-containing protein [Pasteurella skyensis]MDP8163186.1 autotransporter outer membrane beta-barrel domain-containing protein [Pasteurella skyensis]MDP8189827.1 autotransporter outer membrane beta-barrel domain-containing protein [Pasteurella skyensis]
MALSPSAYADTAECKDNGTGVVLCDPDPATNKPWGVDNALSPTVDTSSPDGNTISTSGNTVTVYDTPGNGLDAVFGALHQDKSVDNNTVIIHKGTITDVYAGTSLKDATDNHLTINGTVVGDRAVGGYARGNVTGNTVTVNGGNLEINLAGGYATGGHATNNALTINGGTIKKEVVFGGAGLEDATGNTLTISGGTIESEFYGGYSYDGDATGNTVTINGNNGKPIFGTDTRLHGGYDGNTGSANDVKTGNTLNLHTTGLTVKNINNFENLHFYVQSDTQADETFLTLTDSANTDITGSKVGVGVEGSAKPLEVGEKVVLLKRTDSTGKLLTDSDSLPNTTTGMHGIAGTYEFEIKKQDEQTLIATATKAPAGGSGSGGSGSGGSALTIHDQTQSLLESGLAGLEFVNRGADLANNVAMYQLTQLSNNQGVSTFGAIRGGKYRTETGSHIDVKGVNLLLGVGSGSNNSAGQLYVGTYVEGGVGSYDSINTFDNNLEVRADGDTKYYGIGAMIKQHFNNHLYLQGGVRLGQSHTEYHSKDLQGATASSVDFNTKRAYAGANIGMGYTAVLNDKFSITPSAQLMYTYYSSADKIIEGSQFDFDRIHSVRSRLGAKVSYKINPQNDLYANVAWEREYQGNANGKTLGLNMPAPAMKGNTGIVEIGTHFNPSKNLKINLGATGNFGKRRGVGVNVSMKYDFD